MINPFDYDSGAYKDQLVKIWQQFGIPNQEAKRDHRIVTSGVNTATGQHFLQMDLASDGEVNLKSAVVTMMKVLPYYDRHDLNGGKVILLVTKDYNEFCTPMIVIRDDNAVTLMLIRNQLMRMVETYSTIEEALEAIIQNMGPDNDGAQVTRYLKTSWLEGSDVS